MQDFFKHRKKEIEETDLKYLSSYQNRIVYDIEKGITLAKPNTTWDDICGMDKEKYLIQQDVLMPILLSESKMEVSINSKDLLIYGPSGVGKTLLVQALTAQLKSPVFLIEAKGFVETHKKMSAVVVNRIFNAASHCHRAIVLINDIDYFYQPNRLNGPNHIERQIITEISNRLNDEFRKTSFFIIAVTKKPHRCGPIYGAVSRLFTKIYVSSPDLTTRQALINKNLKGRSHSLTSSDIKNLALRMDGFVSSDIIAMVKYACYEPVREAQKARHFRSITSKKQQKYEACDESTGEEMEFLDIPAENVKLRDIKFEDFELAMKKVNQIDNAQEIYDCARF